MSEKPSDGWLIGLAIVFLGIAAAAIGTRPKAATDIEPPQRRPRTALEREPDELVHLDLSELFAPGAPADVDQRIDDFKGRRQICKACKCSSIVSPVNTMLWVFRDEPHYTCAETLCFEEGCDFGTITPVDVTLLRYLDEGYRIAVGLYADEATIAEIDKFFASPRTLADATPIQKLVHARGLAQDNQSIELPDPDLAKD